MIGERTFLPIVGLWGVRQNNWGIMYLASNFSDNPAYVIGGLLVSAGIPLTGLVLLLVGIAQRSAERKRILATVGPVPFPDPADVPQHPLQPAVHPLLTITAGRRKRLVGWCMIGLGVLGNAGNISHTGSNVKQHGMEHFEIGSCVSADFVTKALPRKVACSTPSSYIAGPTVTGEAKCPPVLVPTGETKGYSMMSFDTSSFDGTLCLALNLETGQCYRDGGARFDLVETSCTTPMSTDIKVEKRVDGASAPAVCPLGNFMIYPQPKVVYCLGPAA